MKRKNKQLNQTEPKEYFVSFFGGGLNAWINVKELKLYECENKADFVSKSKALGKLAQAIEEADNYKMVNNCSFYFITHMRSFQYVFDFSLSLIRSTMNLQKWREMKNRTRP